MKLLCSVSLAKMLTMLTLLLGVTFCLRECLKTEFTPLLLERMERLVHGKSHCMLEWKFTREGEGKQFILLPESC